MNRKQRDSNRNNDSRLRFLVKQIKLNKHICENCGKPGGHYVYIRRPSIEGIINGIDDSVGFWNCKEYNETNT